MTEIDMARLDAIQELAQALFLAAGESLTRHGDDPHSDVLLAAAMAMFIDTVDERLLPGFKRCLVTVLTEKGKI